MIGKLYSDKIVLYASISDNQILIPDLIMVKEGVACGEYIVISGEVDDGILRFNFLSSDCCILCKAVCNYLHYTFNNKSLSFVLKEVRELYHNINSSNEYLYSLFDLDAKAYSHRIDCLFSPIKLLLSFLEEISVVLFEYNDKPNTLDTMECDACVGACRIMWKDNHQERLSHHGNREFSTEYLQDWLPLGKITLNEIEKLKLREMCNNMKDEDYQFLSDHTMNSIVLHHLFKYCPDLIGEKWKAAAYLIQKKEITRGHIGKIVKYIGNNNLSIYFVKGFVSQKYYDNPNLRIHSDYDIISTNSEDAFKLTNYLLQEGFKIRPNLFSFKSIFQNNVEVISGHFHLQKIIDDTYMLEIDISFPGFLLNRVELYYPKLLGNHISAEDQIVITLLHLFKHSNIYMKDINDIFYVLKKENLDTEYLITAISKYHLHEFFSLVVMFIYNNYDNDFVQLDKLVEVFKIQKKILNDYSGWPYDKNMHLKIKQKDYHERLLGNKESERNYLYPVVIFCDLFDFSRLKVITEFKITKILDTIYEISSGDYVFYMTSIGIFINNYIDTSIVSRTGFIVVLSDFLSKLSFQSHFPIPYSTNSFYVRVI